MPGARNLRLTEAAERARLLDIASYDIALDLSDAAAGSRPGTFRGTTEVRFRCRDVGASTFIEVAAERIRSATLNGTPVDTAEWSADRGLVLSGLGAENTLVVDADFGYAPTDLGLHRAVDPEDGEVYVFTQFQPADAQRVFACFDQPDLKGSFTWHATVPERWLVVSTMPAAGREAGTPGLVTVHFEPSPRISTYVTALCAGPYHELRRQHDGIDLGLLCRASLARHLDPEFLLGVTTNGLDFFQDRFGVRYPLPKYDQIAVPEFGGAMENMGCVTYSEDLAIFRGPPTEAQLELLSTVMLHEMAHMWFGDLVTMRWWDDLWLNESFATWAAAWAQTASPRFAETAWSAFLVEWKAEGYEGDQLSSTHPVHADIPDVDAVQVNFDRITYGKGAAVLKQLVAYVGPDAFTSALRMYFERHAWGNAALDDLLAALETASGRPVRAFAAQWLQTAQVNILRPDVSIDPDGTYSAVSIRQEAPAEHPTLRTHRLAIGLFDRAGDAVVRRDRMELEVTGAHTEVPQLTGARVADLLLVNDDDLTYAKVRLDPMSARCAVESVAGLAEPLTRAVCSAAVWDLARDAELAARDFLGFVARALPTETDLSLAATTLNHARAALTFYADPAWALQGWRGLAEVALAAVRAAEASSGRQRLWVGAYATAARGEEDLTRLAGWLRGEEVPDGLEVTADLRWELLQALVAAGAATSEQIETEAASDRTTRGESAAARARALVPTAEGKAAAWRAITDPATPAHLRRASLVGFQHPAHTALTAPYVETYFAALEEIWSSWEFSLARTFATLGYPSHQVAPETLARTDAWLAARRPAPLRRLVADRRDDLDRALRARERDRQPALGWHNGDPLAP